MSFEMKDENGRNIEVFHDLPEHFKPYYRSNAKNFGATGDFGDAVFNWHRGNGFSVWYSNYLVQRNSILIGRSDTSVLELHISVVNQITGFWDGVAQPSLQPFQFNLSFTPHVNTKAIFTGGKVYETCDIHFEKEFLIRLAPDFPMLSDFLEKVEKGIPADLSAINFFCTPDMVAAIHFIHHYKTSERRYKYLLESKVIEILILALERVEEQYPQSPLKLYPRDIEALHEVKRLIELEIDEMPSLTELASKVAINEFKLKNGFRFLFGISPYKYHVQLKMEKAKQLLLDTNKSIVEIAYMLGYQYDNNFSIEFKKHFGYQPGYFRKHGKR